MDAPDAFCAVTPFRAQWCLPAARQHSGNSGLEKAMPAGTISEELNKASHNVAQARRILSTLLPWPSRLQPAHCSRIIYGPITEPHNVAR